MSNETEHEENPQSKEVVPESESQDVQDVSGAKESSEYIPMYRPNSHYCG